MVDDREPGFDEATTRLLRAASSHVPVTSPAVTVVVVEGPSSGLRATFDDLAHRPLLVGQSSTCDVQLADAAVSRRHLSIRVEQRGVALEDLDSSNGTRVNGVLVDRAVLTGGELVRLGASGIRVEVGPQKQALPASDAASFGTFIGASASTRRLYLVLERFAQLDTALLFEGEAGTGKELLAETVHDRGPRRQGPFLVLERGRAPVPAFERLLFGNDGEGEATPGLLERARGGTLFCDEIGDIEPPLQLKLLRALETRAARRVDGRDPYAIDVRLIAATRRNLDRDVHARRFREELLAFLSPGRVDIPPLRQREGDVALLTRVFWTRLGGDPTLLSPLLIQRFEEHHWPGNMRELIAAVARQIIGPDAPPAFEAPPAAPAAAGLDEGFLRAVLDRALPYASARQHVANEFETRYLTHMLQLHRGNVTKAAAAAGISRRHFYRLKSRG